MFTVKKHLGISAQSVKYQNAPTHTPASSNENIDPAKFTALQRAWEGTDNLEFKKLLADITKGSEPTKKALLAYIDTIKKDTYDVADASRLDAIKSTIEKEFQAVKTEVKDRLADIDLNTRYDQLLAAYNSNKGNEVGTLLEGVSREDFNILIQKAKDFDKQNPRGHDQNLLVAVLQRNYREPINQKKDTLEKPTETDEEVKVKLDIIAPAYEKNDTDTVRATLEGMTPAGVEKLLKLAEEYNKKRPRSPVNHFWNTLASVISRNYFGAGVSGVRARSPEQKESTPKVPSQPLRGEATLGDQYKSVTGAKTERGFFEKGTLGDTNMRSLYMMTFTGDQVKALRHNFEQSQSPILDNQDRSNASKEFRKLLKGYTSDGVFGAREEEGIIAFLDRYYEKSGEMKAGMKDELTTMRANYTNGLTAIDARKSLDQASRLANLEDVKRYLADVPTGRVSKDNLTKALADSRVTLDTLGRAIGVLGATMDTFKDPTTKARFFQAMNESLALGISLEGFVRNDTVERDKALKEIGNRTMNSETRERLRKMGEKKYDETLTELETQITKESDTTKKSALEATLKGLKENKEGFFSSWMRSGEHLWALGGSGMYGASGSIDFTKVDGMFEGMKLSAGVTALNQGGETAFVPGLTAYYPIIRGAEIGSSRDSTYTLSAGIGASVQFQPQATFYPFGSVAFTAKGRVKDFFLGGTGEVANKTLSVTAGPGNTTAILSYSVDRAREIDETYRRLESLARDIGQIGILNADTLGKKLTELKFLSADPTSLQIFVDKVNAAYARNSAPAATNQANEKRTASVLGVIHAELENTIVNEANRTRNNSDFSGGGIGLAITPSLILPVGYLEWYRMNLKYSEAKEVTITRTIDTPAQKVSVLISSGESYTTSEKQVIQPSNVSNDVAASLKQMQKGLADYIYELRLDEKSMTNIQTLSKKGQFAQAKIIFINLLKNYEDIPEKALLLAKMNDSNTNLQQFFDAVVALSSGGQDSRNLASSPTDAKVKTYYEKARGKNGSLAEQFGVQYGLSKAEVMRLVSGIGSINLQNVKNLGDIFKGGFMAVVSFNQLQGNGEQGYKDIRDTSYSNTRIIGTPSAVPEGMKDKILAKIEANMSQTTVDRYRAEFKFDKNKVTDIDIKKLIVYGTITPDMQQLGYSATLSSDRLKAFLSFEEHAECFNLGFALNPPKIERTVSKTQNVADQYAEIDIPGTSRTESASATFGANPIWTPAYTTLGVTGVIDRGTPTTTPGTGVTTTPGIGSVPTTGPQVGQGLGLNYGNPAPTPTISQLAYGANPAQANAGLMGQAFGKIDPWSSPVQDTVDQSKKKETPKK